MNPWKKRVLAFNRKRAEANEKAEDIVKLLNALPPGQVKNLLKKKECAVILRKYGITGE